VFLVENSFAEENVYTGVINLLPDRFVLPAIGFLNIIYGEYNSVELGGINIVASSLYGAQAGLINIIGENMEGTQIGLFFNLNYENMFGAQIGAVNLNGGITNGLQLGLYNESADTFGGIQAGGFNSVKGDYTEGSQLGISNMNSGVIEGAQIGVFNTAMKGVEGLQMGVINVSRSLYGIQLGIFNYADSVDYGAPIGLFSIVRDDGYFALEATYSNLAASLRVISGLTYLYSSLGIEIGFGEILSVSTSFGIGSKLYIFGNFSGTNLYFIPEIRFTAPMAPLALPFSLFNEDQAENTLELLENGVLPFSLMASPKFGFSFAERFLIMAGPVFTLEHNPEYIFPNFTGAALEEKNGFRFVFGLEISFRYELTG
jgi:hypothetical protein